MNVFVVFTHTPITVVLLLLTSFKCAMLLDELLFDSSNQFIQLRYRQKLSQAKSIPLHIVFNHSCRTSNIFLKVLVVLHQCYLFGYLWLEKLLKVANYICFPKTVHFQSNYLSQSRGLATKVIMLKMYSTSENTSANAM